MAWLKKCTFAVLALILSSSLGSAQQSPRDVMIERIVAVYIQGCFLTLDSPFADSLVGIAKSLNPGVGNEIWATVKSELVTDYTKLMTERDGSVQELFRNSLEPLSDDELRKLATLLEDPALRKFLAVLARPSTESLLLKKLFSSQKESRAVMNGVLSRHGLKGSN